MDEKKVHAVFSVADTIKDDAKQALEELHRLGIKSVMLT
jgi:cation transport ATPase